MRVDVTEGDIRRGVRTNSVECPVARAVSRAWGDEVTCTHDWVTLYKGHRNWRVDLPSGVHDWIVAFDLGKKVEPFSFELEVPCNTSLELGVATIV